MPHGRRAARLVLPLIACAALLSAAATSRGQDVDIKVVGGSTAEPGEYPWQIAVLKQQGGLFFICGGTLIADRRVVTAAHCTSGNANSLKVLVGTQLLSSGGSILNVSSYADHPSYSQSTNRFDAAVLELASSGIAAGGQPLQLIGAEGSADDALWAAGKMLAISGWGTTSEGGSVSNQLMEARVPRVADGTCAQSDWYGTAFHSGSMVCAGLAEGGIDTCQGDSGGPLAASTLDSLPASENNPSQWRLAGITSWGTGCAREKKPGVYTRVAVPSIRDWILGTGTPLFTLNVFPTGTGSGTVTSNVGGINCPPACSFGYESGTSVTLSAAPAAGSTFTGWSGEGCSGTGTCTVNMTQTRNVTAEFTSTSSTPTQRALTVEPQGGGSGTVTSSPGGINCGAICSATFDHGTFVTLTALAAPGSTFAGWDGEGCSGTGTCTVLMDRARQVTATFGVQLAQQPSPESSPPPPADGVTDSPSTPDGSSPSEPDSTSDPDAPLATTDETVAAVIALASTTLRVSPRGFVRVPIRCRERIGRCTGVVRLRARLPVDTSAAAVRRMRTIGRKTFRVAAGERKRVKLRLTRRARRVVRKQRRLRARIVVVVSDTAGNTRKLRKRVTLRARR